MGYIESQLTKDEKIIASVKHSWAALIGSFIVACILICAGIALMCLLPILNSFELDLGDILPTILGIFGIILGLIPTLIGIFMFISDIVEIKCAQLVVTNKRLLGRRGFISKKNMDMMLTKIDTLQTSNGFFGAIFHYGNIEVISAATAAIPNEMRGERIYRAISNVKEFKDAVLKAIDTAKEEERLAQSKMISSAINNN